MKRYYQANERDPFQVLPLTYHIKNGAEDQEYGKFVRYYQELENLKSLAVKEEEELLVKIKQASNELEKTETELNEMRAQKFQLSESPKKKESSFLPELNEKTVIDEESILELQAKKQQARQDIELFSSTAIKLRN